jgi:hypothetical protein
MIYYQYIATYINNLNSTSSVLITRSCEDIDYNSHLLETKNIVKQVIKASNGTIPPLTEQIIFLTEIQFNNIVKGPDDLEINPDIPIEEI